MNVEPGMRIAREETFGPVAPLLRFDSEDDVIRQANGILSGLAADVYTRDLARASRPCERIEAAAKGRNTQYWTTPSSVYETWNTDSVVFS
jgi:succinate-semialdehyde dehydrogenase/glutarate-semialdehyde dehydrogenase